MKNLVLNLLILGINTKNYMSFELQNNFCNFSWTFKLLMLTYKKFLINDFWCFLIEIIRTYDKPCTSVETENFEIEVFENT